MPRADQRALRSLAKADLRMPNVAVDRRAVDAIAGDLRAAIERDQLALRFQPIVDLHSGDCRRAEALLRWDHPRLGAIDPRDIVRLAERESLARALAVWSIRRAVREREAWLRHGLEIGLAINLTRADLADDGAGAIVRTIAALRVRPGIFTFEIPAAHAGPTIWPALRELAAAGARVSLDDVTGSEPLARALAHEVDEVKVGRALVLRVVADPEARARMRALFEEARDLGLARVAVGIEDQPTLELVNDARCELAQGYLMSRPLAAEDPTWRGLVTRVAFGGTALLMAYAGTGRVAMAAAVPALASSQPANGNTCCALQARGVVRDVGLTMATESIAGARITMEASLSAVDQARITAAVVRDLADTQRSFGVAFTSAPDVYVFATRGSFALGLQNGFGQRATDAAALAVANGGVAFASESAVVVNWQNAPADLSVFRHELTHLLIHQIAGVDTPLPAWFDEGLATLSQREVSDDQVELAKDASTTQALLREGNTPLAALTSPADWTMANAKLGGRAYAFASEAVRLLDDSIGPRGIAALAARARDVGFAQAFGETVGVSPADFAHDFPGRYVGAHGPRIAQTAVDAGALWSATGFSAGSPLHVIIAGRDYHLEFDVTADRDGSYTAMFGGTAPAGSYSIAVSARGLEATGDLRIG